jgi:hypothetical protein
LGVVLVAAEVEMEAEIIATVVGTVIAAVLTVAAVLWVEGIRTLAIAFVVVTLSPLPPLSFLILSAVSSALATQ